jgi:hypothetical protein
MQVLQTPSRLPFAKVNFELAINDNKKVNLEYMYFDRCP